VDTEETINKRQDAWQDHMTNRDSRNRQEQGTRHKTHTVTIKIGVKATW